VWSGLCLLGWLAGAAATVHWVQEGKIQTWNFSNSTKDSQVFETANFKKENIPNLWSDDPLENPYVWQVEVSQENNEPLLVILKHDQTEKTIKMPYKRYNRNKSPIVAATSERTVELCHDETEPLSDLTVTIFPLGQTSSDINVKVNVGLSVPRKWMKLSPADQDRTNLKSIVNQDQVFQASGILTRTAPVVKLSRFPQKLKDESIMVYVKADDDTSDKFCSIVSIQQPDCPYFDRNRK